MSVTKKSYGCDTKFRIEGYFGIADIAPEQAESIEKIVRIAVAKAEYEIEEQLYLQGLMTCNGMLCSIAKMKEDGNDLVQAHIKELETKYDCKNLEARL